MSKRYPAKLFQPDPVTCPRCGRRSDPVDNCEACGFPERREGEVLLPEIQIQSQVNDFTGTLSTSAISSLEKRVHNLGEKMSGSSVHLLYMIFEAEAGYPSLPEVGFRIYNSASFTAPIAPLRSCMTFIELSRGEMHSLAGYRLEPFLGGTEHLSVSLAEPAGNLKAGAPIESVLESLIEEQARLLRECYDRALRALKSSKK